MPDARKHRGPHPEDRKLFAEDQLPALRAAVSELSWLLTREYSIKAALKLVGDRHGLTERQRLAVSRAACSDQSRKRRAATRLDLQRLHDGSCIIDGFNIIITIEAALSGGVLLRGRDGCIRDLSSIHGSYRSVEETESSIVMIGSALAEFSAASVVWMLDRPVSNSGRLAQKIRCLAAERGWDWSVELAFNPDRIIAESDHIVISSDGPLLDQVKRWTNLARQIIEKNLADAWLIDLS
ncbi:MAG TPA: DUF434 domain-containing protein [Pyrinomonadaceae bacterium]|jgi:hypothetical protein|nr:DUF434 domain-containing protein [Pyrinomonadaceae bacterium]